MANPEHVAKLLEGVDAWNAWRTATKDPTALGLAAYLKADLTGVDLGGAELSGADFTMCFLGGANLSGAVLHGTRFDYCDLQGAALEGASLARATMLYANMERVDARYARIIQADLSGATLVTADLRDAILGGTNLSYANLHDADLAGASIADVVFGATDLTDAKGLESCAHYGPSIVDHRTFEASVGLPQAFMRGCGLPDSLIEYLPSLIAGSAIEFYSCFISYGHVDKPFARRLHAQLQSESIRCWLDEHDILPGERILDGIDRGIRLWDKVLLCCSKASLERPWVNREIDIALEKEERLWKKHGTEVLAVIPLNLDGHLFQWENSKATMLRSRLAADFTGWEHDNAKFEAAFEKLVFALRADDGAREPPPTPKL